MGTRPGGWDGRQGAKKPREVRVASNSGRPEKNEKKKRSQNLSTNVDGKDREKEGLAGKGGRNKGTFEKKASVN